MRKRARRERSVLPGRWWILVDVLAIGITLALLFAKGCEGGRPEPDEKPVEADRAEQGSLLRAEGGEDAAAPPALRTRPVPEPRDPPPSGDAAPRETAPALPLTVRFVDALDGTGVQGVRWRPGTGHVAHGGYDTAATRPVPVVRGEARNVGMQVDVESLDGRVAWDEQRWPVVVSRFATALEARYPLRREARAWVDVREADGRPSEDARIERFRVGDRSSEPPARAVPDRGGFLLRGVPFLREEPVAVLAVRSGEVSTDSEDVEWVVEEDVDRGGWGRPTFVEWVRGAAVGEGRFARDWRERLVITATFPHEADVRVPWGVASPGDPRGGESRMRLAPDPRHATVEVQVRRADGRPAADVELRFFQQHERTDARGRATFRGVLAGRRLLELVEPGLVYTRQGVRVEEAGRHDVVLREARGGTLRVRVVDAAGEALPYAEVRPDRHTRWVALGADGVQRIDRFTDGKGERVLEALPPGSWTVHARWSGRYGSARVTIEDGGTQAVTIPVKAAP